MALHIALQMDPIDSLKFASDSTLMLGLEAQRRGHLLYYYQPHQLCIENGKVYAPLTQLHLFDDPQQYYQLGDTNHTDLSRMDVILMRQDPPFDMSYMTATYFLEFLPAKTRVFNHPGSVRNLPEKLFACQFPEFMPPTLITLDSKAAEHFFTTHGKIVLKPLYAFGGQNILVADTLKDAHKGMKKLLKLYPNNPIVLQQFLPGIEHGDKRIFLIDGEYVGALNRIPKAGHYLSNLAQGGTAVTTELTEKEKHICQTLKPHLKKHGIMLAGIDVIDGHLTEINITSPTGLKVMKNLYGVNLTAIFWDKVEKLVGL